MFYKRIIKSVDFYNVIIHKYSEKKNVAKIYFSIIFSILTIYPIKEHCQYINNEEKEIVECAKIEKSHLLEINKQNINDEHLLNKVLHIEDVSFLKIEQEHYFISYIIELTELIFFEFFYTPNANLIHNNSEKTCLIVLKRDTYSDEDTLANCISQIRHMFSYNFFLIDETESLEQKEINEKEKEKEKKRISEGTRETINHMSMFSNKRDLKNSIILLNISNIIVENNGRITPSFFYLSFKILNTLLHSIISNKKKWIIENMGEKEKEKGKEKYKKNKSSLFQTTFSILINIIRFLKIYIEKQINIYIIVNHIIISSISYLYINFCQYVLKYNIKINYIRLIDELEQMPIEKDITKNQFFLTLKNNEKYFALLLLLYKLVVYSKSYEIIPVINRTFCENAIPFFVPKYANNKNPKDILYMYNSKPEFVELKSLKRKYRQEKKLAYNELKKENNFLKGLKIKEEMDRRKRNDEKYRRVKEMAIRDAAEYRKMKTTC